MTIELNDSLRLVVRLTLGGVGNAFNIYYAKYTGAGTATQAQIIEAAGTYMSRIYNEIIGDLNNGVTIQDVTVSSRNTVTDEWEQEGIDVIGLVGGSITGMLPPKAPVRMTARTQSGKSPGKKRLSGYDETTQDQGVLEGPELGRLAFALGAWILGFESIALGLVLESGIFSELSEVFKDFTGSGVISNAFGSQDTRGLA